MHFLNIMAILSFLLYFLVSIHLVYTGNLERLEESIFAKINLFFSITVSALQIIVSFSHGL